MQQGRLLGIMRAGGNTFSGLRTVTPESPLVPISAVCMIIGALVTVYAWFSDVSVYENIANMGAVGQRGMIHSFGLGLILVGVALFCSGSVINEIRRGR